MGTDKVEVWLNMESHLVQHRQMDACAVLFNNPLLRKEFNLNEFTESSLDYNLQPRRIEQPEIGDGMNYVYELNSLVNLSLDPYLFRQNDHRTMGYDNTFEFPGEPLGQADERDISIKKGEKVDEDNYIYEKKRTDVEEIRRRIEKDDPNQIEVIKKNTAKPYSRKLEADLLKEKEIT